MADKASGSGGGTGGKDNSHFPTGGGSSSGHGRAPPMATESNYVMHDDATMEGVIPQLAREAYMAVLRYFRARGNNITWELQELITQLRIEMRLTRDDHATILESASADDTVVLMRTMRESREQAATRATSQLVHNQNPSISAGSQPAQSFYTQPTYIPNQPSTSARTFVGADRNYPSSGVGRGESVSDVSSGGRFGPSQSFAPQPTYIPNQPSTLARTFMRADRNYPSRAVGRGEFASHVSSGGRVDEPAQGAANVVGRGVRVRSSDGHNFSEAVITYYNPVEGTHTLTYDSPSGPPEEVKSVNLNMVSLEWLSNDAGTTYHGGYRAPSPAMNYASGTHGRKGKTSGGSRDQSSGTSGKKRQKTSGHKAQTRNDRPPLPSPQGLRSGPDEFTIPYSSIVIGEVQGVFNASNSTPQERENARRTIRDHEQLLVNALTKLSEADDDDDDTGKGTSEQAYPDLPLLPRQDLAIGPDQNQIRVTGREFGEAERVLNGTEEIANAQELMGRVNNASNSAARKRRKLLKSLGS